MYLPCYDHCVLVLSLIYVACLRGRISKYLLCAVRTGPAGTKGFRWEATYIRALLALELGNGVIGRGSIAANLTSDEFQLVN